MSESKQKKPKTALTIVYLTLSTFFFRAEVWPETKVQRHFQLEMYGGYSSLALSDLNLLVDHDNRIQEFNYDSYLHFLVNTGEITGWSASHKGEREKIRNARQFGLRLKYRLNPTLSFSIELKYFSKQRNSGLSWTYLRIYPDGERHMDSLDYESYSLSVKAFVPLLGFYIGKDILKNVRLEGYMAAGPVFAECGFSTNWTYEWEHQNHGWLVYSDFGEIDKKGAGTGMALDLGGRIGFALIRGLSLFVQTGYSRQVVNKVTGPGSETHLYQATKWDGEWIIKKEMLSGDWGNLETEYPTNFQAEQFAAADYRDFKLDLSGAHFRIGLAFQF